jgi:hypothetical protein
MSASCFKPVMCGLTYLREFDGSTDPVEAGLTGR